jgi:hypothetical protein
MRNGGTLRVTAQHGLWVHIVLLTDRREGWRLMTMHGRMFTLSAQGGCGGAAIYCLQCT